jgi:integrase/recombinase XerD
MTITNAIDQYLKLVSLNRSQQTVSQYTFLLRAWVRDYVGSCKPLASITLDDLLAYVAAEGIRESTMRNRVAVLKGFFTWCVKEMGYLKESPAAALRVKAQHRQEFDDRAMKPADLQRIIEYLRWVSPRNHAMILVLATTGIRVGALVSMTVPNLHIDQRLVWVLEKGRKWVPAYFGDETARVLATWLYHRPKVAHPYLWTGQGPHFEGIGTDAVRYVVREACRRTGCTQNTFPHAIRHALGHALADMNIPASIIQEKLNHANSKITIERYMPHDRERVRTMSERHELQALKPSPYDQFSPVPLPEIPKRASGD